MGFEPGTSAGLRQFHRVGEYISAKQNSGHLWFYRSQPTARNEPRSQKEENIRKTYNISGKEMLLNK